jgi:hypothetical protein
LAEVAGLWIEYCGGALFGHGAGTTSDQRHLVSGSDLINGG